MKKISRAVSLFAALVLILTSLSGCAKVSYVISGAVGAANEIKDGSWLNAEDDVQSGVDNEIVIDAFKAGTYGGTAFKTEADVVKYYTECYNNTKAQTAKYTDADGNTQEYYALLGEETLEIDNIIIDGKKNDLLSNTVPGIVKTAFAKGIYGLPPSNNRDPNLDNDNMESGNPGKYDYRTSYFKPEYCLACNIAENPDGTVTITIQPKDASMSARGADAQGSFFEVLKDLGGTVDDLFSNYDMLSWASGNTEENCVVSYGGGTGKVVINPETKTITAADYHMKVYVAVNHANVSVIKNKSGALYISHYIHYPASDNYLMESKKLVRQK